MSISIPRLRTWFAAGALLAVLVVAGFYLRSKIVAIRYTPRLPDKIDQAIEQFTNGFTFSKSEGDRTLYTVKASKAARYKDTGRAELHDVSIILYGKQSNRFDQISGKDFEYDQKAGIVTAKGEVSIDLQGGENTNPALGIPKELKNPIHLKTSGLVFDQKTGIARTSDLIVFEVPQALGRAKGATYDSKANVLTFLSNVEISTTGAHATHIYAERGHVTKEPQQIIFEGVRIQQQGSTARADQAEILVSKDNNVERVIATGNVEVSSVGAEASSIKGPRAEIAFGEKNTIVDAVFSGGVQFQSAGDRPMNGTAGRIVADFGAANKLRRIRAMQNVAFTQEPVKKDQQRLQILAPALDISMRNPKVIAQAVTVGTAQVLLSTAERPAERTTITANRFIAEFDQRSRLSSVKGEENARIVASNPGQPDRVTTSKTLVAQFAPGGGISAIEQIGDFRYFEPASAKTGERIATSERAKYTPDNESLSLTGAPRFVDGGMSITSQTLRINRRTGDAFAQGAVKTTYSDLHPAPNGAMLAKSDPVHVTSAAMSVQRQSGIARFTGGARLWQGSNIVEAPAIEFDRPNRSMIAQGTGSENVSSVFVQGDKSGKVTPVVVTAQKLTYVDADRRARFSGGVVAKGADAIVSADRVDVLLQASEQRASTVQTQGPSQLNRIVAERNVVVQESGRRATGEHLQYASQDGSFVLTGGPPTILDAQRGTIRGDSLTFYSRDDRVIVESAGSSRTVTRTHIRQ